MQPALRKPVFWEKPPMATATPTLTALRIGPADHGRRLKLDEFIEAEFEEGWVYELARGVVEVTEVPGPWHGRILPRQGSSACCRILTRRASEGNAPDPSLALRVGI